MPLTNGGKPIIIEFLTWRCFKTIVSAQTWMDQYQPFPMLRFHWYFMLGRHTHIISGSATSQKLWILCYSYQVVGPPIYAQISPVSHTFVTSECILYMYNYVYIYYIIIYIYSSLVEFILWLNIHAQVLVEKSWPRRDLRFLFLRPGFTMSKAQWWFEWVMSNGKRWVVTWPESGSMDQHGVPISDNPFFWVNHFHFDSWPDQKTCATCIQCICDVLLKNNAKTISCLARGCS